MKRGSLLKKIITWTFVPTVTILVAVALVNLQSYQKVAEDLVIQRNRELARLMASRVTSDINMFQDDLSELARTLGGEYLDLEKQKVILTGSESPLYLFDSGIMLQDHLGIITTVVPERPELIGQDWSNTQLFKGVSFVRRARPYISDVFSYDDGDQKVLGLATPIFSPQGDFVGVVTGLFQLQGNSPTTFYGTIARLRFETRGTAYLVDGMGNVIYHTEPNQIGQNYSEQEIVGEVIAGKVGSLRTKDGENNDVVASYAPILGTRWGLVIQESWGLLLGPSLAYRYFLLFLLAVGITAPAGLVITGIRRITRPIIDLTKAAQEVAGGKFDQIIYAPTGDEVEELAEQFNRMSAQLQESYANLERRVEDRTHELSVLNAIAQVGSSSIDLDEICDEVLQKITEEMGMEAGAVYLQDNLGGYSLKSSRGFREDCTSWVAQLPLLTEHVGDINQPELLSIQNEGDYPDNELGKEIQADRLKLIVFIPLVSKAKKLGLIILCAREQRQLSSEETSLLSGVGNTIGVAIENASLYTQVQRSADQISTLFSVQQAITRHLELDEVLQMVADEACRLTGIEISYVYLMRDGGFEISVMAGDGNREFLGERIPLDDSIMGLSIRTGETYLVNNAMSDPRVFKSQIERAGVKSFIMTPLISERGPLGTISVATRANKELGKHQEHILQMFASVAVIAIENARYYQEEHERRKEADQRRRVAETLRDILATLNTNLPVKKIFNFIVAKSNQLLGSNASILQRYDIENQFIWWEARDGLPADLDNIEGELLSTSMANSFMINRQPFVFHIPSDVHEYLEKHPGLPEPTIRLAQVISQGYRTYLSVPLIIGNDVYGALTFFYEDRRDLSDEVIGMAVNFADQAALAIANARLRRELEQTAVAAERNRLARELHDAVTQTLFSASLIAEVLPRLWERNPEDGKRRLEELRQQTRGALAEMRTLLLELRPTALVEAELCELLKHLAEAFTGRTRVPVQLNILGECDLTIDAKIGFYRIAQEALNNITKHAGANQVWLEVDAQTDRVRLEIRDDGRGFHQGQIPPDHLGLGIMRERAENMNAELSISSEPGKGTQVALIWVKPKG